MKMLKPTPSDFLNIWLAMAALSITIISCAPSDDSSKPTREEVDLAPIDITHEATSPDLQIKPEIVEGFMFDEAWRDYMPKPPFAGLGAEPFWLIKEEEGWLVFERPALPPIEVEMLKPQITGKSATITSEGLTLSFIKKRCVTPKGEAMPYEAKIEFEGTSYFGCAWEEEVSPA